MGANVELQLICKIVDVHDFHTVERLKIDESFFLGDSNTISQTKEAFRFIRDHYHNEITYGSVPSWELLQKRFYGFPWTPSWDTLPTLCQELRRLKLRSQILSLADEINQKADVDPGAALEAVREASITLVSQHDLSDDMLLSAAGEQLYEDYQLVASGHGLTGIPWPWDILNEDTQGIHKGNFIVIYGRPKSMKCVVDGEKIMMRDGALVPIEKVPEKTEVPSYTERTGRVRWANARRVSSGEKDCVEVTTESGLCLRTSTEHLYMIPGGGYERICKLRPGSYIATARTLPSWSPSSDMSDEEAQLLGLLVGDGNYTRGEVQFTSEDEEIVTLVRNRVSVLYGCSMVQESRPIEYRIVGVNNHNALLDRLRELGMHGKKGPKKTVPDELYRASKSAICAFLGGMLDTDGHVSSDATIWNSSSRELLDGAQHLLTRLGVRGKIGEVTTNYGTLAYTLVVHSKEQNLILYTYLKPYLCLTRKRDALRHLAGRDIREKRNSDAIPYSDTLFSKILAAKAGKKWPRWGHSKLDVGKLFRRTGRISRHLLELVAEGLQSEELLHEVEKEIIWEKIKSIEPIGRLSCSDICIDDGQDPNFVVGDFIVHNSWMALYVASMAYMTNMRVLVYSLEMSRIQVLRRCAAIISRVDYDKFKKGKLDPATQQRVFDILYTLRDDELYKTNGVHSSALMATSPSSESSGVATLQAKIREFDPDLVIVDGMYLMKDDRVKARTIDWKSISHISQDLKRTASHMNVPIIGVTQANRGASKDPKQADLAELSYADALGQDCDLCMRVTKQKDQSSNENEIVLSFPGSREGILENFVIHGIPATNFTYKRATVVDPSNPQSSQPQSGGSGRGSTKITAVLPTTWRNP